jgi:hypothetical protein
MYHAPGARPGFLYSLTDAYRGAIIVTFIENR